MKQQLQHPVRRSNQQRPGQDDNPEIWPLSAREFMKLPLSGPLSIRKEIRLTRLTPADQAA